MGGGRRRALALYYLENENWLLIIFIEWPAYCGTTKEIINN